MRSYDQVECDCSLRIMNTSIESSLKRTILFIVTIAIGLVSVAANAASPSPTKNDAGLKQQIAELQGKVKQLEAALGTQSHASPSAGNPAMSAGGGVKMGGMSAGGGMNMQGSAPSASMPMEMGDMQNMSSSNQNEMMGMMNMMGMMSEMKMSGMR